MADCTIRRRDESWIEVVLPTPSYAGELGKAHQIMLGQLNLDPGVHANDDAYTVTVGDDEIILRARLPKTTVKVSWADSAVEQALERLITVRECGSTLHSSEQALLVAIDCLRAVAGQEGEHGD